MKKFVLLSLNLLFAFSGFTMNAQNVKENVLVGNWFTENNEAKISIYKAKDGKYYGNIIWLKEPNDKNGAPKKDIKNKHENLQNRCLLGIIILNGLQYNSEEKAWDRGRVYKPEYGHDADCIIYYIDDQTIKVKGYMGVKWLSETQVWKRVK